MNIPICQVLTVLILLLANFSTMAENVSGSLSENIRIHSAFLDYSLQYRVYLPPNYSEAERYPVLYVTDGQWYIRQGELPHVLDKEIIAGRVRPMVAVFVDSRDPDNYSVNRRNKQFMCNTDYARFVVSELIPRIDTNYSVSQEAGERGIAGLSFGGLNAACFGLIASHVFTKLGMQSPASAQHLALVSKQYLRTSLPPLRIFLSAGTRGDNIDAVTTFRDVLVKQGHDVQYLEVNEGHNWQNWKPLLGDMLIALFGVHPA